MDCEGESGASSWLPALPIEEHNLILPEQGLGLGLGLEMLCVYGMVGTLLMSVLGVRVVPPLTWTMPCPAIKEVAYRMPQ